MPGQRTTRDRQVRASWVPRIAGAAAVLLLAGGGITGYLVLAKPRAGAAAARLPAKVLNINSVGLVTQLPVTGSRKHELFQLVAAGRRLQFSPLPAGEITNGHPQWTADQMRGGTYIFIYISDSKCLTASGTSQPVLSLQHCDLGAQQRWQPVGPGTQRLGRVFSAYRNYADGQCLGDAGQADGKAGPTALARCQPAGPASQLIAFWWSSA